MEMEFQGHMPLGTTKYPHEKTPDTFIGKYIWLIIIIALIIFFLIVLASMSRVKKIK